MYPRRGAGSIFFETLPSSISGCVKVAAGRESFHIGCAGVSWERSGMKNETKMSKLPGAEAASGS